MYNTVPMQRQRGVWTPWHMSNRVGGSWPLSLLCAEVSSFRAVPCEGPLFPRLREGRWRKCDALPCFVLEILRLYRQTVPPCRRDVPLCCTWSQPCGVGEKLGSLRCYLPHALARFVLASASLLQ